MKRKFLTVFLAVMATLCMVFALSACDLFGSGGKSTGSGTGNSGTQTEQGGNTQKPNEGGQGSTEPEKKEFTVTFNANGGEFEDGKSAFSVSVKENETLSLPEEPTRDKYEFVQWCTDSSLETAWDFSTPVTRAMTLYADWKALVTEFDVTFILNYEGAENVVRSTENGLVTFIPERADYVFNGWWLSDGLTESGEYILSQKWDTAEPVTEAGLRLVAEWVEKATVSMQLPAPSVTINEAVFSWEAIAGAKEYDIRVYKAGSNAEETKDRTDGTTWTFPSGFDAGYYTVKIRALGDGMTTVNSAFVSKSYGHLILSKISEINFDISTSILTWTAVRKATSYVLYIDSVETKTLSYTSFDMSAYEAGSHSVQITAKRNGYQSSTVTTTVEKKRLKTPEVTVTKEDTGEFPYTITWQPVAHADTYILTLNGVEHRFTDKTSYTFDRFGDWGEERMIKISLSAFDSYADYAVSNPFTAETERVNVMVKATEGGTVKLENGDVCGYFFADEQGTVVAKTNKGYTFVGWYKDEQEVSTELTFQFTMVEENVITYEARWKVSPEMQNFEFTSTEDTCTITGVKNTALEEIVIPDYVTEIKQGVLKGCSSLQSLTIPFVGESRETAKNTYQYPLGYIFGTSEFSGASAVKQSYYYSTSSTTSTTFYIPNSLKHVTITGGEILYGAFYNCSGLTSVTIGNGVTSIGSYAFRGCSGLTSVTIPDSVTSIGGSAFYDCSGLKTVMWNAENCTKAGSSRYPIFNGCTNLSTVTFGDDVETIPGYAFYGCSGLTSITIPDSVTSIGDAAFEDCSGLKKVHISDIAAWCKISFGSYIANPLYYARHLYMDGEEITELKIPDSVTSIGDRAFYGCSGLTGELKIPDSVTSIGDSAFLGCSGLTSVTIGSGVTAIGDWAFNGCSGLTSVTIGSGVTSIGDRAFSYCSGLTEIKVEENNPTYHAEGNCLIETENKILILGCQTSKIPEDGSVTSIGNSAFEGCSGLAEIKIPDSVTSIGNSAFEGCSGLAEIKIPDSVTSIGERAFYGCSGLTEITIPDSVTSIGGSAFYDTAYYNDDSHWTENVLYISNHLIKAKGTISGSYSIRGGTKTIAEYAFSNHSELESVTVPDSVISIGNDAFWACSGLTEVTIGSGVTSIGWYAFENCSKLEKVYFENSNGWKRSRREDMSSATDVSGLNDPETAARYLKSTYCNYYWHRYD